ncbi:MAG: ABC transporter ATP-binding protein [Thermacetogeniaceae bacterium]
MALSVRETGRLDGERLPASDAKIVLKNISRIYQIKRNNDKGSTGFIALQDVNLQVRSGELISIVGPSGCGKSTLLDLIAGLARPNSGEIFIDGRLITGPALDRGIILQGYALFPWRVVLDNVAFGLEIKGVPRKERRAISQQFIDLVGLQGFEDRYPYELSGGMKQRVAIARALAYDPGVLLMDEPFAAVDAQTREVLQDELLQIWDKTGKTIVFVTHSIEEAIYLSDRVAVMTPNPGTIKEVIEIKLPRPRQNSDIRSSAEFGWVRHKVRGLLQNGAFEKEPGQQTNQDVAEAISTEATL